MQRDSKLRRERTNPTKNPKMKLTDEFLISTPIKQKPYKVFDGGGLFVDIAPSGLIKWRYKYSFGNKQGTSVSLGSYPEMSISEARQKRDDLRAFLKAGIEPLEVEKANKSVKSKDVELQRKRTKLSKDSKIKLLESEILKLKEWLEFTKDLVRGLLHGQPS